MRKEFFFFLCTIVIAILPLVHGISQDPKAVQKWFKQLPYKKQKMTNLHFYVQENFLPGSPTQTAYQIAQSNISSTSPTSFGETFMSDDPITVNPDPSSNGLGRFQGLTGLSSLEELRIHVNINLLFTQGKYNGSSLQLFGSHQFSAKYRESSIVGGTGVFRLARGIATSQTYFSNATSSTFEYHVVVIHY